MNVQQPIWLIILSLGISGSLVAAVATALNDFFRRRFELRKWRAEFFLRPKLDALRTLHTAMVKSHYQLNVRAKAIMPRTIEEWERYVKSSEEELFNALTFAEIYLDAETSPKFLGLLAEMQAGKGLGGIRWDLTAYIGVNEVAE